MAFNPPPGTKFKDRVNPTVETLADIPKYLDAARAANLADPTTGHSNVIGTIVTERETWTAYIVRGQPPYGTAGTLQNYVLEPLVPPVGTGGGGSYALSAYDSAEALLTATPPGETAYLDTNLPAQNTTLTLDTTKNVRGQGAVRYVTTTNGVGGSDLIRVHVPVDAGGNRYSEMWRVDHLLAWNTTGRDALRLDFTTPTDGTPKPRMGRPLFTQLYARSKGTGWAFNVINPNTPGEKDAFFLATFLASTFDGGLRIRGGGDSNALIGSTVTGPRGLDVELNTRYATDTEASQFMLLGSNFSAALGAVFRTGTRTRVIGNNMELVNYGDGAADMSVSHGLLALLGTGNSKPDPYGGSKPYTEVIEGATVFGNYIATAVKRPGLTLDYTDGAQVFNNTFDHGAGETFSIVITANTKNAIIGPNVFRAQTGYEIDNKGIGTMGVWVPINTAQTLGSDRLSFDTDPCRIIKRPDALGGAVFLCGSLTGGPLTKDTVLLILPVGFRPVPGRNPRLPVIVIGKATNPADGTATYTTYPTWVVAQDTGQVVLGETLGAAGHTLQQVMFGGVNFESPLV